MKTTRDICNILAQASGAGDVRIDPKLDAYLRKGEYKVPGYAHEWDLFLFFVLLAWQSSCGFRGDLAEIGVHHGRSFLVLAMCRQPGEGLLAIDLFEDDYFNEADPMHNNRGTGFFANLLKYGVTLEPGEIIRGSSLDLNPQELLRDYQPIRFFSIDGGHFYHHVANDLEIAVKTIADCGVVCVDDWMNDYWPEVSIAAGNFLRELPQRLVPFLVNQNKLYLCRPDFLPVLQREFLPMLATEFGGIEVSTVEMFGHAVTHVKFGMAMRLKILAKNRFLR
jgi:hypothetical protein